MIWSVSTSERRSGTATPVCTVNFSIRASLQVSGGREPADDRGRRGHGWRDQVRAPTPALPALEVAVGRGRRTLARLERVRVHAQAHGAAGEAPLGPGVDENLVQAL